MAIEIPGYKNLSIRHIVCDYNGTIAKDGIVLPEIKRLFSRLSEHFTLYVVTADTFGSVETQLKDYGTQIKVLSTMDHTKEKADFIASLGADLCAALGNGNNDAQMLKTAAVGIAILGNEGCSMKALSNADIVCKECSDALTLFLEPRRLIATLRK